MRILFLSPWFPNPPVNGSKIRIYHLLRALTEQHEVHLISFVREGEVVDRQAIETQFASIQTVPFREFAPRRWKALLGFFSPTPRVVIDTYSREMDAVVKNSLRQVQPHLMIASQLVTAEYAYKADALPKILEDFIETTPILEQWTHCKRGVKKARYWLTWLKHKSFSRKVFTNFDACVTVSEEERRNIEKLAPDYHGLQVVSNGVDLEYFYPNLARPQSNSLIYNGALTYSANFDAMQYFLNEIYPAIRLQVPETRLKITGATDGVDLGGLPLNENVILTGYLPDIRPAVAGAWACVVPLRIGGGTRLKILEALALGTPVVSTSKGAEGLDVTHEENILIADTPQDFAAQTVRLLTDPELRARLAKNGRELVEAQYGWQAIGEQFVRLVEETAARSTAG